MAAWQSWIRAIFSKFVGLGRGNSASESTLGEWQSQDRSKELSSCYEKKCQWARTFPVYS